MRCNKVKLIILLLVSQSYATFAQTKTSSLLWEISGNGISHPSYLYGTIHLIDQKDFLIRKEIDSVFNLAEQIAFEIKMDDATALSKIEAWFPLPEGKTFQDYCSPAEYEKIKNYLMDSMETDIKQFNDQKPFVVAQLQMSDYIEGEMASYELYFMTKAMSLQKPMKGLELIEEQLNLFDMIPYEEQIDWVVEGIDSASHYSITWSQLIEAYKNEDLTALWRLFIETTPELVKYEPILISNRNKNWIPVIEEMIKTTSTFIAVGAGHLPGEMGVIELLIKQGYSLRPL